MEKFANKETRLKKLLADNWGKDETEINLLLKYDPLVKMLFRAVMYQYEDVYSSLHDYKKELLIDTAKRLLPDYHFNAIPAHTLLQAQPPKGVFTLKALKHFSYQNLNSKDTSEMGFVSLVNQELFTGDLLVMGAYNGYFNISDNMEFIEIAEPQAKGHENVFYLGIKTTKDVLKSLDKIVLFFGYNPCDYDKKWLFNAILSGEWMVNGHRCKISESLTESNSMNPFPFSHTKETHVSYYASSVIDYYHKNFVTIHLKEKNFDTFGGSQQNIIPHATLEEGKDIKLWITINSTQGMEIEKLHNIFDIRLNTFPVMNCKLKSDRITKTEPIKKIETNSDEFFLCLNNSQNENFGFNQMLLKNELIVSESRYKSFEQNDLLGIMDALIRAHDTEVGLTDSKGILEKENLDLMRKLSYVLHDLKTGSEMKELMQNRKHVKSRKEIKNAIEYQYFITNGDYANDIPANEKFLFEGIGIKDKSALSVVRSCGGKEPQNQENIISALRFLLLSRDRIVTREDVRSLCFYLFGHKNIQQVLVTDEIRQGRGKTGLHKVIAIQVLLNNNNKLPNARINALKNELLSTLLSKSINLLDIDFDVTVSMCN